MSTTSPYKRRRQDRRGHRFPTFIGAATPVITGLLIIIAGIILAVMDKNDRKTFVSDTNKFAYDERR